ncbi:hypothetical protein NLX82_14210 [Paenibacillus sp. A3M_27_13]|uniref:Uncharacterized protein n=1 Tax=Paenibacillus polymyxa TaxID=1406 RepID=A0AAP3ZY27_PAEPO|nr:MULTISPECIES: hypothetical protein [Paenibacillus]MCP3745565.1 hypothetical protein [Paenibacillus sp. A3M_27_13]MDH2331186.1 hypothetical protein [Paenibacillus polymyxa]
MKQEENFKKCGKKSIKKMALLLVTTSFLLVLVLPVQAKDSTLGKAKLQEHTGTA